MKPLQVNAFTNRQDERTELGFTLMEVTVALAIVSIVVVSIYCSLIGISDAIIRINNYNQSVLLAQEQLWKLEEIWQNSTEEIKIADFSPEESEGNRVFKSQFTEESVPSYEENLKEIDLTIHWQQGRREGNLDLATYFRQRPQWKPDK